MASGTQMARDTDGSGTTSNIVPVKLSGSFVDFGTDRSQFLHDNCDAAAPAMPVISSRKTARNPTRVNRHMLRCPAAHRLRRHRSHATKARKLVARSMSPRAVPHINQAFCGIGL